MRIFNVLFGFEQEKTKETILRSMNGMGLSVRPAEAVQKETIRDYINTHADKLDAVILKEYLDGGGQLGVQDLVELSENNKINFVIVLDGKHRGQDTMRDLFAAGILNACFSEGKYGVNADILASLAVKGRTHREAREYYRIGLERANHRYLSYPEFKDLYSYLLDDRTGLNILDRFICISRWIDEEQLGSFIKTLPKATKEELCNYKEFIEVNNRLYRLRFVDDKYSITNNTKEGLNPKDMARKMVEESRVHTMPLPGVQPVKTVVGEPGLLPETENTEEEEVDRREDLRSYVLKQQEAINHEIENDEENITTEVEEMGSATSEQETDTEVKDVEEHVEPEPALEQTVGEGVQEPARKPGLFSSLKNKVFNPDRGMVVLEEEPVIISEPDIPVTEVPEFSDKKETVNIPDVNEHTEKDIKVSKNTEHNEKLKDEPEGSVPPEPVLVRNTVKKTEEKNGVDNALYSDLKKENEELKAKLAALEKTVHSISDTEKPDKPPVHIGKNAPGTAKPAGDQKEQAVIKKTEHSSTVGSVKRSAVAVQGMNGIKGSEKPGQEPGKNPVTENPAFNQQAVKKPVPVVEMRWDEKPSVHSVHVDGMTTWTEGHTGNSAVQNIVKNTAQDRQPMVRSAPKPVTTMPLKKAEDNISMKTMPKPAEKHGKKKKQESRKPIEGQLSIDDLISKWS